MFAFDRVLAHATYQRIYSDVDDNAFGDTQFIAELKRDNAFNFMLAYSIKHSYWCFIFGIKNLLRNDLAPRPQK